MKRFKDSKGFTFIEVLVTLVILSVGIMAVFRSFLLSLDYLIHLNNRLYATILIDDRIDVTQRILRNYKSLPLGNTEDITVDIGSKEKKYIHQTKISEISGHIDIFELEMSLQWQEKDRNIKLSRFAYLSEFKEGAKQ